VNNILSFEEFLERQNNFYLYFNPGWVGDVYRKKDFYKKFATENPVLNEKLLIEIQNLRANKEVMRLGMGGILAEDIFNISHSLFEAYQIMINYADNKALFE